MSIANCAPGGPNGLESRMAVECVEWLRFFHPLQKCKQRPNRKIYFSSKSATSVLIGLVICLQNAFRQRKVDPEVQKSREWREWPRKTEETEMIKRSRTLIKKRTKVTLGYFGQACLLLDALKRNFGLGSKRSLKAPKCSR